MYQTYVSRPSSSIKEKKSLTMNAKQQGITLKRLSRANYVPH